MEKIVTGQKSEIENHDDHGLAEELESLYCHVADLDQAESSGKQREDRLPESAGARIPSAAAPLNIRQSNNKYRKLSPDNHYQGPLCQDTLTERLNEIADAYEDISALWPYALKHPLPVPPGGVFTEILSGETQPEGIPDYRTSIAARHSLFQRYSWSIGSVATIGVIIFMFFLWPTLYHYDSLKVGNQVYPLRINRLTAHLAYFDGKVWIDSPIPENTASQQVVHSPPVPAHAVIPPRDVAALPLSVVDPVEGNAGPPSPGRREVLQEPMTFTSPVDSYSSTGDMPSPPVSIKDPLNSLNTRQSPPDKGRRYSIQVKAFRDERDAQAFADDLQKKEPEIHIETILLEGGSVWHRILLGSFKTENEALNYFTVNKIKKLYPGSFIKESQKRP